MKKDSFFIISNITVLHGQDMIVSTAIILLLYADATNPARIDAKVLQNRNDESRYTVIEEWRTKADVGKRLTSAAYEEFKKSLDGNGLLVVSTNQQIF